MADSEDKLCGLLNEFGGVCETMKFLECGHYVDKSKVMGCGRYVNVGQMNVILNGEQLEEADCFKYLRSQMVED